MVLEFGKFTGDPRRRPVEENTHGATWSGSEGVTLGPNNERPVDTNHGGAPIGSENVVRSRVHEIGPKKAH